MYLKSIKAYGFKSFADKTEIIFGKNLNGVVGPNGSGKSNIVDAVRWVLGEQSMKSLRGDTSTDIIFSGSKSRKPLNSASVTLIFDNTDHTLPIDYSEVSIKRIVYRSGENEYYLNNERCRLKDINDILVDSGAAKESFNIISQGKIDEILSTKPQDRRVIFEEAAGVLKYKKRKEEAIRKLERTNSNLDRVKDIILELERNLEPLKKQSEDAKTYMNIKEKLTNIEVSLITSDIESLTIETKEMKDKITTLNDDIIVLNKNNTNYDIDLLKEKNELKELEITLNNKQTELLEITKKIEQIDADIRLLKERNKYSSETNKINDNIIKLKEEELKIENNIVVLRNEIDFNNKKIKNSDDYLESLSFKYKETKNKYTNFNNTLNKNNREIADLNYRINYLENSLNNNNSLPNSIKSIMNNPRFTGVHNIIGNLIDIKESFELAIETALGSAVNYLVVDTPDTAKELVNYLKDNNIGRATFFPLSVIKERTIDSDTLNILKSNDNFIGTADTLVSYSNTYRNIILNQLGNVIVTKSIASANLISRLIGNRYKIVTIDGQIVNVGGSITGGNSVKGSNIIKEKYELEKNYHLIETLKDGNKNLEKEITNITRKTNELEDKISKERLTRNEIIEIINTKKNNISALILNKEKISKELTDLENIIGNNSTSEEERLLNEYYKCKTTRDTLIKNIDTIKLDKEKLSSDILEIENNNKTSMMYINKKEKELKELEIKASRNDVKLDNLLLTLSEEYNMTFENAKLKYKLELEDNEARNIVSNLKSRLRSIGEVNLGSVEEYERVSERYNFLTKQKEDLLGAEDTLLEIIKEMDSIMESKFKTTFDQIQVEFKKVFKELFRGGEASLVLTEPDNILETGIDIKAVPSGKNLKSLSLLSGGEKTFTAISLLFAILNVRPVPFCLLDEVEAALDDANVESFGQYLNKYRDKTQFILITHKKKTMEFADILYGITMQESGVSKLVSVKLEDIKEDKSRM
jgi:chromosome segregation protein